MNEQTASKVPQIRFKGFEEDWNTCSLDKVATVERGKFSARPRNDPRYFGGNIPFVQTGDVVSANRLLKRYSQTLNEEGLAVSRSFPENTILITIAANIGDLAITDFSVACPDSVVAINARNDFDTGFLYDFLGTKKGDLEAAATTAAQANINLKILKPLMVVVPTLDEQTKIGKYFRELDSLIGLHQCKHDKLVTLKKAMLQKMFPQPGATTPEIRFKGFSSPWVSIEMEKIGQTYSGLFGKTKDDFGHGGGRFVTYMGVFNNAVSNLNVTDAIGVDPSQNEVRKGDVLFTISSETPHEVGMSSVWAEDAENVYLNSFCFGFRPIPGLHSDFLAYVFRADEFRKRICILAQGISRYNISKTKVMKIPVSIPNPAEQQKIGTYFRTLDSLISKHATQLQKLQQIKSACLEKMFV